MRKILKAFFIFAFSYLFFSTIIPVNLAQYLKESESVCLGCRPTQVLYCSKPLNVEIPMGDAVEYPSNGDDWTENSYYLGDQYWIANNKQLSTDRVVGQYSFYGEQAPTNMGVKFSFWWAVNSNTLDISIYDEVHFWFKSPQNAPLSVYLSSEDGNPLEISCNLGNYKASDGWKEYNFQIGKNCTWNTEKKPIEAIYFYLDTGYYDTRAYIDGLYIKNTPTEEDSQYYFFIDKNSQQNLDLKIKDVSSMQQYEFLEVITGTASEETDKKTIHTYKNSSEFILHGNGAQLDVKKLDTFTDPVYLTPFEKCDELVSSMLYSQLKVVNDYAEGKYQVALQNIRLETRIFNSLYNEAINPTGEAGLMNVGSPLEIIKVTRNPLGTLNFNPVFSVNDFNEAMLYLKNNWARNAESLAYGGCERTTGKIVKIFDVSDIVERGPDYIKDIKLTEFSQLTQWLNGQGLAFYGDEVHSHVGNSIILPSVNDILIYGQHIENGYPFTYGRPTILQMETGQHITYLLDRNAIIQTTSDYIDFVSWVRRQGFSLSEIERRIKEYGVQVAPREAIVYEITPGINPAIDAETVLLELNNIGGFLETLEEHAALNVFQIQQNYIELYTDVINRYGSSGVIPNDEWLAILSTIEDYQSRSVNLYSYLLQVDQLTMSALVKDQIANIRYKIAILDGKWSEIIGQSSVTPGDLALSASDLELLHSYDIDYMTIVESFRSRLDTDVPFVVQELANHGIYVSERPELSQRLTADIERMSPEQTFDLYEQTVLQKKENYFRMARIVNKLGFAIKITSTVGIFLTTAGVITQQYGRYLDDINVINIGNYIFLAGLATDIITGGLTVAAALMSYSIGELSLTLNMAFFAGIINSIINGIIIGIIAVTIINMFLCWFSPQSPYCGCSVSPFPGSPKLELERDIVVKGDPLIFATSGMQYCYPSDFFGTRFYLFSSINVNGNTEKICKFEDGFCCDGSVKVDLNKGEYDAKGTIMWPEPETPIWYTNTHHFSVINCNPSPSKTAEDGLCHIGCGADLECGWVSPGYAKGYPDNIEPVCSSAGNISANQIRGCDNCLYKVNYDSYINEVSVNGAVSGDINISSDQYIEVIVKVENTGSLIQGWWMVGVEFWKVSDYTQLPSGVYNNWDQYRSQRVDTWYNGYMKQGGNIQGITDASCELISKSNPSTDNFVPGETITLKCQVPASFYGPSNSPNERIMFWVHQRDYGQDAGNDGCGIYNCHATESGCPTNQCLGGNWWSDALSKSYRPNFDDPIIGGPASVRVRINNPSNCQVLYDKYLSAFGAWCNDQINYDPKWYQNNNYVADVNGNKKIDGSDGMLIGLNINDNAWCLQKLNQGDSCLQITTPTTQGSSGGCLIEGTKVLTPEGLKKIEDLNVGDSVIGYKDGKKVETKVLAKMTHSGTWTIYYYKGSWFTGNHRVYPSLNDEAVEVQTLSSVTKQYTGNVYDIKTGTENYFGENDLLIHNKGGGGMPLMKLFLVLSNFLLGKNN